MREGVRLIFFIEKTLNALIARRDHAKEHPEIWGMARAKEPQKLHTVSNYVQTMCMEINIAVTAEKHKAEMGWYSC